MFKKSSFCSDTSCVEVSIPTEVDIVTVRNSDTHARILFTKKEWEVFILGAKAGEFDIKR